MFGVLICFWFALFSNHVHGHLSGGAILAAITAAGPLLAAGGVADHVHTVHAAVRQILAFSERSSRGGGAEQATLRLLWAGCQARRGREVVSVQVVRIVKGKGVVCALLHVMMAPSEHVGRGRGGA